jgi:hypothetical protein
MKFSGSTTLHAPRDKVWETLNDPAVLARAIPGCESLEQIGPDAYRVRVTAGVASIKGTYQGEAAMVDPDPPRACTLKGSGGGAPGTVSGECRVTLEEQDGVTLVSYDAEGVVGGVIGGVGQRVLTGVAKKMAAQFFGVVDDVLTGKAPTVPAQRAEAPAPGDLTLGRPGPTPSVFAGTAGAGSDGAISGVDFVKGAVFGAAVAITGVAVGGLLARSHRR